jgi:very-short-patch-repair endonuclease
MEQLVQKGDVRLAEERLHSLLGSHTGESLRAAAKRVSAAADLRAALESCQVPAPPTSPPLSDDSRRNASELSLLGGGAACDEAVTRIDSLWPEGFVDGLAAREASTVSVAARCDDVVGNIEKLQEWIVLQHTLARCSSLGLMPFVEALGEVTAKLVRTAFERRFYGAWANAALDESPTLVTFSGPRREDLIRRFRLLDDQLREAALATCKLAASEPARRVATAQPVGAGGDVGVLRRELEKRKRIKPLRKLFGDIPGVLQALKPCFLMSPLSVSTFLRPGAMSFDLVVFDEASQLPTPEAIPAILRANQTVVAGDKNQLPPTSFFDASVILDESAESDATEELEPLESLLDECVSIWPVFEQTHLRWHYRSRDERLVRFSNHYFYREKPLITFPSPIKESDTQGVSVLYVPDGIWDKGKSRTNRQEARVVAKLVVEQVIKHPERSVGVVAMNANQREAIEESIDELLPRYPTVVPHLRRSGNEPFFIKSLENVQGDERDTMVISVGYGKNSSGTMSYNFGPVNQDAGWRRLNVLVTRARWQTILVTSMRSHELSGINPNNRGASALRDFIAYAERKGELPAEIALPTDAETNDFEDGVAAALRGRGLQVDEQVGTSEYRIDLAVRDSRDTNKYVLGIECDGASYHSARTARDRDLVRHLALRELGWRLYRIWSTDWFRNPDQAILGVLRALEVAIKNPAEEPVAAPVPRQTSARDQTPSGTPRSPAPPPATASKRYSGGKPYERCSGSGRRELLLNSDYVRALAEQVARVVEFEGPMHTDLMTERLKDLNGVARAGKNVKAIIYRAVRIAEQSNAVKVVGDFLHRDGARRVDFRTPGDGIMRPLAWIPREEIELAVLHVVEEQFGYQREALPHAISEVFGFERTSEGGTETIGGVVDDLVERGLLRVSGPNVYLE